MEIVWEDAANLASRRMNQDSTQFLNVVKYAATAICGLMLAGVAALMFLARGTGEDITGIVAPALLIAAVSSVTAIVASVVRKRAGKGLEISRSNDRTR